MYSRGARQSERAGGLSGVGGEGVGSAVDLLVTSVFSVDSFLSLVQNFHHTYTCS